MNKEINTILQDTYEHNHILPFLWLKGESKEIIKDYMEQIYACGIREVCLESRPHPEFCKEGYWNDLAYIISLAKQMDMKLWILDDSHFPTGYANGLIKEKYPEHKKTVLVHRVYDVVGPQKQAGIRIVNPMDDTAEFLGAVAIQGETRIDISAQVSNNIVFFDAPGGNWKIVILTLSHKTDINEDYINMVDKESCNVLIEAVYEPHYQHFQEEFGNTIVGFFSDEPGFMNEKGNKNDSVIGKDMPLPWSEAVAEALKTNYGEAWLTYLPSLWLDEQDAPQVRYMYMDIVSNLYKECFDETIGVWCKERNVMHIGHVIEDRDSHARLGVGTGHFFRAMANQDMAGVDIVINQVVPGIDEGTHFYGRGYWDMEFFNHAVAKLGSSLAHIDPYKQGRCMAEVFGAFGWQEGLREMKWISDHFLVSGVNYFVPHAFSMAKFPDWDCPPHFYAHGFNPQFRFFPKLMEYMGKMSTLLSGGKAQPTAAILYHAEAEWSGKYMSIQKPAKVLSRQQVDFDFIPAEVFQNREHYRTDTSHGLRINETSYSCFILPYAEYVGKDVVDFLVAAKTMAYPVYIIDALPSGMYDSSLPLPDLSHIKVVPLHQLGKTLKEDGQYELCIDKEEPYLRYYHYKKEDADYYMFFNEHPKQAIDAYVKNLTGYKVDVLHHKVERFHEHLCLHPYESCIICKELDETYLCTEIHYHEEMDISHGWQVQFADAQDYPNFDAGYDLEELVNLSTSYYPDKAGTFRYRKMITIEKDISYARLMLDEVYESVEVWIDGKKIGDAICPPYHFDLQHLTSGEHELMIEVTNTLDHMLHDYMSLSEVMMPSGLFGSVTLRY